MKSAKRGEKMRIHTWNVHEKYQLSIECGRKCQPKRKRDVEMEYYRVNNNNSSSKISIDCVEYVWKYEIWTLFLLMLAITRQNSKLNRIKAQIYSNKTTETKKVISTKFDMFKNFPVQWKFDNASGRENTTKLFAYCLMFRYFVSVNWKEFEFSR